MKNRQTKLTILYSRLSREDERGNESLSIENQKKMLEDYAERNGFIPYIHISDDGYSGTNFQRPGWEQLIEQVESGNVQNVLLKDLSRMGRDYLRVGLYREMFHDKDVRLIAINDGFDSTLDDDGFTPFKEIISEWYARDISKKIKSVMQTKGNSGKTLTTLPIYGYIKDPADKNSRLIDPESAEVVRRMFKMAASGIGVTQIARILTEEKIERPSYYMETRGIVSYSSNNDISRKYIWCASTIGSLLSKREYMGDIVNFKTTKPSFKSKKCVPNPPEKHIIFENAIPAIVDRETWELAQKCRETRRIPRQTGEPNPLTGLIYCYECGGKMTNHRDGYSEDENGAGKYKRDTYECSTHRAGLVRFDKTRCSLHYIRSVVLRGVMLDAIRNVSTYARRNEAEFVKKVHEAATVKQAEAANAHKRKLSKNQRRIAELDMLYRKVYEDNATGKITDERFALLSSGYESEQAELKTENSLLDDEIKAFEENSTKAENFVALVKRYTEFDELTTEMMYEFIDKVYVHEPDRSSGERRQRIDIHMRFIGDFKIPAKKRKPKKSEIVAEEKILAQKLRNQKNCRNYRARKKAEELQSA